MATGVNIKMGVEGLAKFKSDIREAKDSIKTLDAQLALAEKQFKATGDEEEYLRQKTEKLTEKLEAQKAVAAKAEEALKQMTDQGVNKSSKAFQDMLRNLTNAKGDILETEQQLAAVGKSAGDAGDKADEMNGKLKQIGDGVAWENVTDGLDKVLSKLESGARAAINFGKRIAASAMSSTQWADNLLTTATKYGISPEKLQQMQNVADFVDTDVDTILNAQSRLAKNSDKLEESLGINTDGMSIDEAFWAAGEAIMALNDEFEKEEKAQALFGRGWKDLVPLFTTGEEEYNRLLEEQNVLTNEQVENLGKADDAIKSVEHEIERMKNQFWAENADKIIEMGQWIVDNAEGLKNALIAIAGGFAALKLGEAALNIAQVVNGFKTLWGGAGKKLPTMPGVETAGGGAAGTGAAAGAGAGAKAALTKAATALGPVAAVAGTSAAMFFGLEQAYTNREWGEYNRNVAANAGSETALMEALRQGISDDADWEQTFREHAEELRALTPDNPVWDLIGSFANLADGLQQGEIDDMFANWFEYGMKGEDITEMFKEAYNRLSTDERAIDRMNQVADESNKVQSELAQNMVKPEDLKKLQNLPNSVADAVSKVGFVVELDGENVVAVINRRLGIKLAGE